MATKSKRVANRPRGGEQHSKEVPPTSAVETQPVPPQPVVFEDFTVHTKCSECGSDCLTKIKYASGNFTWSMCFICALGGGILGCCLVPFFVKETKDILHICPDCEYIIARYNKM